LTFSDNGANSVQYSWYSTNDILSALYYTDSACTTSLSTATVIDFSGYTINACNTLGSMSGMYSTSASYSLNPSAAGVVFSYAATDAECTANQFFESTYINNDFADDDFDIPSVTVTCFLSSFSEYINDNLFEAETYMTYSTVSGSSSSSSSDSCFAGSETVLMENGEVKAISDVVVGDSILASDASGNTKFSNVVAVPHGANAVNAEFVQLTVASGADIKMTPEHLVMASKSCVASDSSLMAASAVESGMCLMSTSGMESVEKVATVQGRGVYSVVTEEEFVVVNGFVASPFAVNHAVANAYYNIVRAVPSLMNFEIVKKATNVFGSLVTAFSA